MTGRLKSVPDYARVVLAAVRLFNGSVALLVPAAIVRRLGADPEANPVAFYALRMFGVRTILIGAELLMPAGEARTRALRMAPLIHASDTVAAVTLGVRGGLPRRAGMTVILISMTNVILAFIAQPRRASEATSSAARMSGGAS